MNNLNITNIHDNCKSQVWIGLDTKKFQIKNTGSMIAIEDKANSVYALKVGGSAGFTITYSDGKISFTANSGSLLAVSEPARGGISECPFYYCHQDKYSGGSSYSLRSNSSKSISIETTNTTDNLEEVYDELKLPDATDLEDGTIMMTVDGHRVAHHFAD